MPQASDFHFHRSTRLSMPATVQFCGRSVAQVRVGCQGFFVERRGVNHPNEGHRCLPSIAITWLNGQLFSPAFELRCEFRVEGLEHGAVLVDGEAEHLAHGGVF